MLIGSITRASGSSSSGVAWRLTSVPSWRRIPLITGSVVPESQGVGVVGGGVRGDAAGDRDRPELAVGSPARNAATAAGVARIVARPRLAHQLANTRQSCS